MYTSPSPNHLGGADVFHPRAHRSAELGAAHRPIYPITGEGDAVAGEYQAFGVTDDVHANTPCGEGSFQRLHAAASPQRFADYVVDAVFGDVFSPYSQWINILLAPTTDLHDPVAQGVGKLARRFPVDLHPVQQHLVTPRGVFLIPPRCSSAR